MTDLLKDVTDVLSGKSNGKHATLTPWDKRVVDAPVTWHSTKPERRDYLFRDARTGLGVFVRGRLGLLIAAGGVGKTQVLCQAAIAHACAVPWLGAFNFVAKGRTLLVLGEETADECHRRLYRSARAMNAPPWEAGSIVCLPLAGIDCAFLSSVPHGDPTTSPFYAWFRTFVQREHFDLVCIDPLSRFGGRDAETTNAGATRFIQTLEDLEVSTIVGHHNAQWSRKGGEATSSDGRGVTGLFDGGRWQASLVPEDLPEADEHLRELVTLSVTKSNYARKPKPIVLRRSDEHGGALVGLDVADVEAVDAARVAHRSNQRKEQQKVAERAARESTEDAALDRVLATGEQSEVSVLVGLRAALGTCGDARGRAIIRRAVDAGRVLQQTGPRNAHLFRRAQ